MTTQPRVGPPTATNTYTVAVSAGDREPEVPRADLASILVRGDRRRRRVRMVSIHPRAATPSPPSGSASPALPGFDHRDTAQHKRLVTTTFADGSWRVPELLERVRAADDIYVDPVSQVRLPQWSSGRIAVLGEAASCLSLFGDGSTLAVAARRPRNGECRPSPLANPSAAGTRTALRSVS